MRLSGAAPGVCEIIGAALAVREIENCYQACSRGDPRCGP